MLSALKRYFGRLAQRSAFLEGLPLEVSDEVKELTRNE